MQLIRGRADSQQRQGEQIEALPIGQLHIVGQIVVHPLMDVIQEQNVRPGVLQQIHLIIDLLRNEVRIIRLVQFHIM